VKPQFEVGKGQVGKGGVVREDTVRWQAVSDVCRFAEGLGYCVVGKAESRLPGPKGKREVFVWLQPGGFRPA